MAGRSPLLRLQTDEKLVALIRRGHHGAFEALVQRYQPRLLAFCRHMLGSQEDAEDVLQEVFAASFNAICADDRPINARPWLYRIARNRCLNHLRRPQALGQDEMDIFERDGGTTTADTVHRREEFRQIVADVQELPETQRTALLLREIDALSYDQIAEAMDTTVPSVKSLLVRARVSLAEAAEARLLTCEEVRLELGQVAEGIAKTSPPVRRHLRGCERCRTFRGELRRTNKALAAVYPVGVARDPQEARPGQARLLAARAGAGRSARRQRQHRRHRGHRRQRRHHRGRHHRRRRALGRHRHARLQDRGGRRRRRDRDRGRRRGPPRDPAARRRAGRPGGRGHRAAARHRRAPTAPPPGASPCSGSRKRDRVEPAVDAEPRRPSADCRSREPPAEPVLAPVQEDEGDRDPAAAGGPARAGPGRPARGGRACRSSRRPASAAREQPPPSSGPAEQPPGEPPPSPLPLP